jgi:hypothetical protein
MYVLYVLYLLAGPSACYVLCIHAHMYTCTYVVRTYCMYLCTVRLLLTTAHLHICLHICTHIRPPGTSPLKTQSRHATCHPELLPCLHGRRILLSSLTTRLVAQGTRRFQHARVQPISTAHRFLYLFFLEGGSGEGVVWMSPSRRMGQPEPEFWLHSDLLYSDL